jgi:predicted N-acyltransferase
VKEAVEQRIAALDAAQWNALSDGANPFVRHAWLAALETTGCVGPGTGWQPATITLSDAHGLAAAAPAYLKQHSYGEFVFDFSWAQAYARAGLAYYPKLIVAVPFTPATGPRLLVRGDLPFEATAARLLASIESYVLARGLSTAHVLFPDEAARRVLETAGWLSRRDCQFHWRNRGYADFDAFLASFTAEKRKKAKRERRRVAEQGIHYETRAGADLSAAELDRVYALHRDTFLRHGHEPYLTRDFFTAIAQAPDGGLVTKLGMLGSEIVATAILFAGRETLYGRYWGAAAELHSLHFETCYHQGIELCLERGLQTFEPGTQGEHKVARGFEPTLTWSSHFIADPRFRVAIGDFLRREGSHVDDYAAAVSEHVPYREGSSAQVGRARPT